MNRLSILIILSFTFFSCKHEYQEDKVDSNREIEVRNALVDVNRYMTRRNMQHISNFVRRAEWPAKKSETGLWYWIYKKGKEGKVNKGDIIAYSYTRKLINGQLLDSIPESRPVTIQLGQGGVEAGIEEGLLKMHVGGKAKFILPPHLAFGNFGDSDKVPPGAILIYDVYLQKKK